MAVRGRTREERDEARNKRSAERRNTFYRDLLANAPTARQKLAVATDYAKAIGDELDEQGRLALALAITKAADERSPL